MVFKDADFSITRGDKISLIGKNGTGKSTLIKSLVNDLEHEGSIELGHQVMLGYFAQDESQKLNPNISVFDTIDEVAVGEIRKKIRQILGSFLFSGDDAEKKVDANPKISILIPAASAWRLGKWPFSRQNR